MPILPLTGTRNCLDCTTAGPDGFRDLTLRFDTQMVLAALGPVQDNACLALKLTGNLKAMHGGTPIAGEDVVRFLCKGGKP